MDHSCEDSKQKKRGLSTEEGSRQLFKRPGLKIRAGFPTAIV